MLGVVILLLMMATAFMGYVLPWGQMSYWGATVITNLFSAIPVVGQKIVTLLWGGFTVGNPTLNRFFSLHYLLPFVIVGVVVLHLVALHRTAPTTRWGSTMQGPQDSIPFHPYYTVKDLFGLCVFLLFYAFFVFYCPNLLGDAQTTTSRRTRCRRRPTSCRNGTSCRSTRSCARSPSTCSASQQAGRRGADVLVDPAAVPGALARHLAGAQRAVPADLQMGVLAAGDRRHRARLWSAPTRRKAWS